jgi:hypothetical protein
MSRQLSAVLIFIAVCGSASGAELFTAPVRVAVGERVTCGVVNLTPQTRTFEITFVKLDGTAGGGCGGTVGAGRHSWCSQTSGASAPITSRYCKITLFDVNKENIRGGISNDNTGVSFAAD